jgi:hypothetical protein
MVQPNPTKNQHIFVTIILFIYTFIVKNDKVIGLLMCWSDPMSRFTGEQKSYFEGMKILIDLYYTHRDENSDYSGKSANKYHENKDFCFSNDIVEKYIRLFCAMIPQFSPFICINRKRTITFIFRGQDYLMVFNPKMWLVRYFDGLYQEIL